jgi:hypothetical protein
MRRRNEYLQAERRVLQECYRLAAGLSGPSRTEAVPSSSQPAVTAVVLARIFAALSLQAAKKEFYGVLPLTALPVEDLSCSAGHLDEARAAHFREQFAAEDATAFLSFTLQRKFATDPEWKLAAPGVVRNMCRNVLEEVRRAYFSGVGDAAGQQFSIDAADAIENLIFEAQTRARTAAIEKMGDVVRSRVDALSQVLNEILRARSASNAPAVA